MTDITLDVSTLLIESHKTDPIAGEVAFRTLDSFLNEARQINRTIRDLIGYVRAVRTSYLSTALPPRRLQKQVAANIQTPLGEIPAYVTDAQREEIDEQTGSLLRSIDGSIRNLQQACELRHNTAQQTLKKKYGSSGGFLLRWAAGGQDADIGDAGKSAERIKEEGQENTLYTFREAVLWYLNWGLSTAVQTRQEMVEKRLEREREKQASALDDERNKNVKAHLGIDQDDELSGLNIDMRGKDTYNPALDGNVNGDVQNLSPEQLQLFEEENNSLLNHYNETLTQVTQVEKSLLDISSLQQTLIGHLTVQGEMIGNLVEDAASTDENVQRGNKELKRATERTSTAKLMYHTTLWLCAGLVVWDIIF